MANVDSIWYFDDLNVIYVNKFVDYIKRYLSKVPDTKFPIHIRLAEDVTVLNDMIDYDGFPNVGQFDRSTLGSYLHDRDTHFIYVRLTGNMNTDVFTFCHELAHVLQFEDGKLIKNGRYYLTSDPFFDMDDLERAAMSFARELMFGATGGFSDN